MAPGLSAILQILWIILFMTPLLSAVFPVKLVSGFRYLDSPTNTRGGATNKTFRSCWTFHQWRSKDYWNLNPSYWSQTKFLSCFCDPSVSFSVFFPATCKHSRCPRVPAGRRNRSRFCPLYIRNAVSVSCCFLNDRGIKGIQSNSGYELFFANLYFVHVEFIPVKSPVNFIWVFYFQR